MISTVIWYTCIALEAAILLRGALTGLLKKYPLFHTYIACVLVKEIIGLLSFAIGKKTYDAIYWPADLATILASYAIIVEIFRWSTRHQPGIRRFTHRALLFVFVLTTAYAASDFLRGGSASLLRSIADLGRDLRYVEAAILLVLLWLLVQYRIPLGRNLLGLLMGYSFWLGVNVIDVAFRFQHGNESSTALRALVPATYAITLGIWFAALWSSYPGPLQPAETAIEKDYAILAARTRSILARSSTLLTRIIRP